MVDKWDEEEKKKTQGIDIKPGQETLEGERIGFIENERKFRDTIKVYERILEKELELSISGVPFMPRTDDKKIYMPKSLPGVAQEERDLYVLMEQQLAKHIAKSDGRNAIEFIKNAKDKAKDENGNDIDKPVFTGYEHSAHLIYNIVDMHRAESYLAEIFKGTGFELKQILRRFVKTPPQNALEVLWAVKCRRMDLVPPQFQQLADEYMMQLQNVENCTPEATYPVTKRLFRMIQEELEKDKYVLVPPGGQGGQENDDPFAPKVKVKSEKSEGKKDKKQDSESEGDSDDDDSDDDDDDESDDSINEQDLEKLTGEGEGGEGEEDKEKEGSGGSEGESGESDGKNETGESDGQGKQDLETPESAGSHSNEQNQQQDLQKQMEDMTSDFIKSNPLNNTMADPDIIQTEQTKFDEQKSDEETLEDAKEAGEDNLEELKDKLAEALTKVADSLGSEEEKESEGIYTANSKGEAQRVVDRDDFSTYHDNYDPVTRRDGIYTDYDHAAVRQLRELFRRIKGKSQFRKADEGTNILIDGYIQRRAGNAEAKVFEKKVVDKGLNIAYCIDLSSSMKKEIKFAKNNLSKMNAVKHILITLHEATDNLSGVNLMMFAFADEGIDDIAIPQISRKRLENIAMGGWTATHGAVRMATAKLMDCSGKKLLVILTDGHPNNPEQAKKEIESARKLGISVYTVIVEPITKSEIESYVKTYSAIFGLPNKQFAVVLNMKDAGRILTSMVAKHVVAMLYGR